MKAGTMLRRLALMCAVGLLLAGCGRKPSSVDPPQGKANDHFPQPYPNLNSNL